MLNGSAMIYYNEKEEMPKMSNYFDMHRFIDPTGYVNFEIANFHDGYYFGLRRSWDSKGLLNHIAYFNHKIMSPSWMRLGDYWIFSQEESITLNNKSFEGS